MASICGDPWVLRLTYTAITTVDIGTAQIYGNEVLLGIGAGSFVQAGYAMLLAILEPDDMAFATSYMMLGKYCLHVTIVT